MLRSRALFEVDNDTKRVVEIKPTTFPELGLWERRDLEAWVTTAPDLAGGEFTVVTSEYDRFDRTNERLDVLGIVLTEPGHARLVVVELKRDGTSTTVDLQAIKYAAYVAAAQFSDVVEIVRPPPRDPGGRGLLLPRSRRRRSLPFRHTRRRARL
jgi:hypothetical protein